MDMGVKIGKGTEDGRRRNESKYKRIWGNTWHTTLQMSSAHAHIAHALQVQSKHLQTCPRTVKVSWQGASHEHSISIHTSHSNKRSLRSPPRPLPPQTARKKNSAGSKNPHV